MPGCVCVCVVSFQMSDFASLPQVSTESVEPMCSLPHEKSKHPVVHPVKPSAYWVSIIIMLLLLVTPSSLPWPCVAVTYV